MLRIFLASAVAALLVSCATPLKTADIRKKIEPGMSAADTLMLLSLPDAEPILPPSAEGASRRLLIYHETGIYFLNDRLVQVFDTSEAVLADLEKDARLREQWADVPDNRNKIAFSEEAKKGTGPVNTYRAFFYLNDELSFREAIRYRINPEGYSSELNALCLAIRGGFTEAVRELLEIGVNTEALLRDHEIGKSYIKVRDCVSYQKDAIKSGQVKALFKAYDDKKTEEAKNSSGSEKPEKSLINWDAVKDWLKPQQPGTDQRSK